MEYISEALNHSNMKTTQNYFAGFEDSLKNAFNSNIQGKKYVLLSNNIENK